MHKFLEFEDKGSVLKEISMKKLEGELAELNKLWFKSYSKRRKNMECSPPYQRKSHKLCVNRRNASAETAILKRKIKVSIT